MSRYEDKWSEYMAQDLREEYFDLKALHEINPRNHSKKDLKALRRAANYYSLPKDKIDKEK